MRVAKQPKGTRLVFGLPAFQSRSGPTGEYGPVWTSRPGEAWTSLHAAVTALGVAASEAVRQAINQPHRSAYGRRWYAATWPQVDALRELLRQAVVGPRWRVTGCTPAPGVPLLTPAQWAARADARLADAQRANGAYKAPWTPKGEP